MAAHRRTISANRLRGVAQFAADLFGLHQDLPALGKRLLFAHRGGKLGQFGMCMGQIIGFAPRLFDARFFLGVSSLPLRAGLVGGAHGLALARKAAECVEQLAVGIGADEGAVIMLAVDLDKFARDRPQGLGADRLIVDERAGAPVLHLDAAQDQAPHRYRCPALCAATRAGWLEGRSNTAVTCP